MGWVPFDVTSIKSMCVHVKTREREREREQGTGRVKFALSFPLRFLKRHPPLGMLCNFTVQYEFEFQPSESCGQCYKCARTIITYKAVILNGPFPVSFLFFFK